MQAVEKPASQGFFGNKRKKDIAAAAALEETGGGNNSATVEICLRRKGREWRI
jgi:hypothetical protein